jgi:hypothetical protein
VLKLYSSLPSGGWFRILDHMISSLVLLANCATTTTFLQTLKSVLSFVQTLKLIAEVLCISFPPFPTSIFTFFPRFQAVAGLES